MISNINYNILQLYNLFTNEFSAFDFAFRMNLWYSHTKWEFFNEYDSKSRNIIQSCGRISIGIEKNRIRFYLNDDIFSQFLFVYFTLDCHYFVKKY